MYNCGDKFVDFEHWCPICKYYEDKIDKRGEVHINPHCDECIETPVRFGTSKPLMYEEK